MCGVFTDNQPDFSWLAPGEERAFTQFFMPYKGVGVIKNATIDAAVGLELANGVATVRAYVTAVRPAARVSLVLDDHVLLEATFDGDPRASHEWNADVPAGIEAAGLHVTISDADGRILVDYQQLSSMDRELPPPADSIPSPVDLPSNEALYLAGVHLEQYRHATRDPELYFREAIRRDPGDARCNLALGRLLYRRGLYAEAERCFGAAVKRVTRHNPNPCDGEAFYAWGLSLAALRRFSEAEAAFHKAAWSAPWQDAGWFQLARLAIRADRWDEAEMLLKRCLDRNGGHHQAVHLLVCAFIQRNAVQEAERLIAMELDRDPFNAGVLFEQMRLSRDGEMRFQRQMRGDAHNYMELANDYTAAGLDQRCVDVLSFFLERHGSNAPDPLLLYHLAAAQQRVGDLVSADGVLASAASLPLRGFFPNSLADLAVLEDAAQRPDDSNAQCSLGNILYSKRRHEDAIRCWQQATESDPASSQPRRNLGLAFFNKRRDPQAAWESYCEAF